MNIFKKLFRKAIRKLKRILINYFKQMGRLSLKKHLLYLLLVFVVGITLCGFIGIPDYFFVSVFFVVGTIKILIWQKYSKLYNNKIKRRKKKHG